MLKDVSRYETYISHIQMSEGQSIGRRLSGGGGRAECHATPPPPPLTRSATDQNTTSRAPNSEGEGASSIKLRSDDTGVIKDVTSGAEKYTSWQVVTGGEGEKKGLSPGELTGGCVLERATSSGQPSGQLIGKPVTQIQGGQVTHIKVGEVIFLQGGEVPHICEDGTERIQYDIDSTVCCLFQNG